MLKRLIEVALPLKEVSEHSAREKSIRHGHISTLHIWWARRPLAACRAVVFASLIPDPDDPECPDSFRTLVNQLLPRTPNGDDSPRNRCLEFIKHLVRWENSNNQEIVGKARQLIAAAHTFLHPDAEADMPKVLDPFAGGGAIPLEALRLGCDAHAVDLNPVAHLIELCTLVYPQQYGQPNSRPTPDYIKALEAAHRGKAAKKQTEIRFGEGQDGKLPTEIDGIQLARLPLITEAEYQRNPLAADVKFWGHWVLEKARDEIGQFYPPDPDGSVPVAYLWARMVKCPNPACGATIPLVNQHWLGKKANRRIALRMLCERDSKDTRFEIAYDGAIDFDPAHGTMTLGSASCPFCSQIAAGQYLRTEAKAGRIGQRMMVVITLLPGKSGKRYRIATPTDEHVYRKAEQDLRDRTLRSETGLVPHEPIPEDRPSPDSPGLSCVLRYGFREFGQLFNKRQLLALSTFVRHSLSASELLTKRGARNRADAAGYAVAVGTYLGVCVDELTRFSTSFNRWKIGAEAIVDVWGRQSLPMVWDYCENNTVGGHGGTWEYRLGQSMGAVSGICSVDLSGKPVQASATAMPYTGAEMDTIATDPPYYDSVPYGDLSDFFYVWLKRSVGKLHPQLFRTPLTPKAQELIAYFSRGEKRQRKVQKTPQWYETEMRRAFSDMHRVLRVGGILSVMFAHKTTSAWESLISALGQSGFVVTASWPLHTEMSSRMVAQDTAALASSVTLACRKRLGTAGEGYWDDVRGELRRVARERLDFFWKQGIRGADFFISAIGPALSVYGRYAKVTRLTGEDVSVAEFLDEVRGVVTDYALTQILHGAKTGQIDSVTRFYVLWKWSYSDGKVPADEAFKLAQALGIDTESMWDRTGVLEKQGENVQVLTVGKRMRINDLGEANVDGSPSPLIDTLHRCCAFREKGDTAGLSEYIARSGHGRNEKLWTVAQAISEVLPDGDKEKQLLQGLLNQRDGLEEAMREGRLF